ncbi:murein biosynthesis integral membrane protein MurJ [Herpetosiphon sp. NSE202]|uniref:murein biosynthesis integral membrane protein MurJ n=1 Tax=Herpetosiphon sp. NSE202 TaxID=3351349 RepID=UPI003635DDA2
MKPATIVRTSLILIAATAAYKVLGFAEKLALAHFFGTSTTADAYLAGAAVVLLMGFLLGDIAGPTLVPMILHDRAASPRTLRASLGLVGLAAVPLTCLGWLYAVQLARLFGPGFDQPTLLMTAKIIRIGLLAFPVMCFSAVLGAWYQAFEQFTRPALADLMLKLVPVIALLATGSVYGLAWGLVVGAVLRLIPLLQADVPWLPSWRWRGAQLTTVLQHAYPLLLTSLVSVHLISVIENAIASTVGAGAVAAQTYARRIVEVPIILLPQVLGRVLFPILTGLVLERNYQALQHWLARCWRWSLLLTLPLMVLGMVLCQQIVALLLQRGAFDQQSVQMTSTALWAALPGLPALALSTLLIRFSYAMGDTRWPSVMRVLGALLQIGLALWWRRWGLTGLGWATTVSLWAETLALAWLAQKTVQQPMGLNWRFTWQVGFASGVAGVAAWLVMQTWQPSSTASLLLSLSSASLVGLIGFMLILALGRNAEIGLLWQRWQQGKIQ